MPYLGFNYPKESAWAGNLESEPYRTVREYLTSLSSLSPSKIISHLLTSLLSSMPYFSANSSKGQLEHENWLTVYRYSNAERILNLPFVIISFKHHFPPTSFLLSVSYSVLDFSPERKKKQGIQKKTPPQQRYHRLIVILQIQSYINPRSVNTFRLWSHQLAVKLEFRKAGAPNSPSPFLSACFQFLSRCVKISIRRLNYTLRVYQQQLHKDGNKTRYNRNHA